MVKSFSIKKRSKLEDCPWREIEGSPFEKVSYLEPEKIGKEECSQLLVKPYNNNNLQEDKQ